VGSRGCVQGQQEEGQEPASCRWGCLATAWDWNGQGLAPEVGKVTFKINGDEALSDESVKKAMAIKRQTTIFLKN
jgi:hypothetical protein